MKFWAINEGDLESASLILEQRQQPSLTANDRIVLFKNQGDDLVFTAIGFVSSTAWKPPGDAEVRGNFKAVTSVTDRFTEARKLVDYRFSLERVNDFENPAKNFSGKYTQLIQKDFDAILYARIYWSRTAFALYFRAMPPIVRIAFFEDIKEVDVKMLVETDYVALWQEMKSFLRSRLFSTYELLNAIEKDVAKLKDASLGWEKLAVATDETESSTELKLAAKQKQLANFVSTIFDGRSEVLFEELDSRIQSENVSQFSQNLRSILWHQILS